MGYKYSVSYAPSGRAQCRACGKLIKQGALRISRESGPIAHFGGDAGITNHFHYKHGFDAMLKSRCATNVVASPKSLTGFSTLTEKDKKAVQTALRKFSTKWKTKCGTFKKSAVKSFKQKSSRKKRSKSKRKSSRKTSKRTSSRRRSRH